MLDWSLVSGPIPIVLAVVGGVAMLVLLTYRPQRRWWYRAVPVVVLAAGLAVGAAAIMVAVARLFPDPVPPITWWSLGVALVAIGLATTTAATRGAGRWRRALAPLAAVVVVVAAANQVNVYFAQFPTTRAVLGLPLPNQVEFTQLVLRPSTVLSRSGGQPLAAGWRAPAGMPAVGLVSQVVIPARVSGFRARPGWVYLPPAYLATPRARLPVLVLLHGQPGSPRDWLDGGHLAAMMDRFAAAHDGLAPVVVMPDPLGAALANPLCLDSRLGRAQTYLAVDVPAWIRATFQVDPDPTGWAVAGLSEGGTCALQLAVNAAQVYPSFVDISGQVEPTLGDRRRTVGAAFGGDTAAFTAVNPLDVLMTRRFPAVAGVIVVGSADRAYLPQTRQVAAAARRAGIRIEYRELPGGHDWRVWSAGLETSLPWLATRLHLTP